MTEPSNAKVGLVASGLWLFYQLYRSIDQALLVQALQKKVPLPHVSGVPSWEETEAFVVANPEFLNTPVRQEWWDARDQIQGRVSLMIALGRELRGKEGEEFYLFAPEVRQDAALVPILLAAVGDVTRVLNDPALSPEQKVRRIMELLQGGGQ